MSKIYLTNEEHFFQTLIYSIPDIMFILQLVNVTNSRPRLINRRRNNNYAIIDILYLFQNF